MHAATDELLSAQTVAAYLERRGLASSSAPLRVHELGGGVSNVVLAVETPERRLVVKQALPRLRVAEEWLARPERALAEARALALAGELLPGRAPQVLDVDEEACAFTIEQAPDGWHAWKDDLLAGSVDPGVAAWLGGALARWHGASTLPQAQAFADVRAFVELRVEPYHRTAAARNPALAALVERAADELLEAPRALVHGDFSPKNVLVGPGGGWLIDFEVVHLGNPVFDLAFMLNHLLLKAAHLPAARAALARCAATFLEAYGAAAALPAGPELLRHAGCLALARLDGKSPAEYLSHEGRGRVRRLAGLLIATPPADVADAFAAIA